MPLILGFAVVDHTITSTELGIVLAAQTVGFLVAVPVAGVLADRYSRRVVIFAAGLSAASATPLIAAGLGRSTVIMTTAAFVVGAGAGACQPAFQALTAEVVDLARRQQANALMVLAVNGTRLVAPGLTASVATAFDTRSLLIGTAVLWLATVLVPPGRSGLTGRAGRSGAFFVTELLDGLHEARRHPWFVAGLAALSVVIATGYSATAVALPLISRDRYGTEIVLVSATTAFAVGAGAGALLIAKWRPRSTGWVALAGLASYGFAPLSLLLPVHPAIVIVAYIVAGGGLELFNVPWFTATQREVEPHLLARVSSLDFLLSFGLAPVGLALIAPAIDAFGAQVVLATCTLTCFLAPGAAALVPSARNFSRPPSHLGTAPSERWN